MWWPLLWPAIAFAATVLVALLVRGLLLSALRRWGREGALAFAGAVRVPSLLWCAVLALFVAIGVAELPDRLSRQLNLLLQAGIIFSVTVTVAGVAGTLITRAAERSLGGGVTGWMQTSARLVILLLGGLVLVSSLGIEITPILTALGVGGLAVALALQDTLSNLFAGMHLLADKPIRVGDYVKLSEGDVEGFVVDVGWRSTRIRMLANNVVVVPNQKVAQSVVTNYDLPDSRLAVRIEVGVDYASDPEHVEAVLLDEALRAAGKIPGFLADPPPAVRFIPGFGASSLDFTLICHVATFVDQYLVQHELRKRLFRRLRAEGIEIPFPQRVVHLRAVPDALDGKSGPPSG
jgi:small-conductance mechanosensitive channel